MSFENEIAIPVPAAAEVWMRCSPCPRQGTFDPGSWPRYPLSAKGDGWWILDIPACHLANGTYEYEFQVRFPGQPALVLAADPFADEIVKFGGYRGVMHIAGGARTRLPFSWADEIPPNVSLPQNNQLVVYELPVRWVDTDGGVALRQVGLGTFEKTLFERLEHIKQLGCNALELLPIQDSPDTLNWGYGTRFFYAPDHDMGEPFDLKLLVKRCHQHGMRVILDVVMNHARNCPLRALAYDWYFGTEGDRNAWGGDLFKFAHAVRPGYFPARTWHKEVAEFWIREYRIDGLRIDEFKGIENWDFLREFRAHAWAVQQSAFPGRPFIVIAEDSGRRPEAAQDIASGGKVVDAIWDFDFRDEVRRLCSNRISTVLGKPSRSARVQGLIRGDGLVDGDGWRTMWNARTQQRERARFGDLAQRIVYVTSHDVEGYSEQRLYPFFLDLLRQQWGADWSPLAASDSHSVIVEQIVSAFAVMLTTPGIPMFLAGEEFADLHDAPHEDWRQKMSDPVNWNRLSIEAHRAVLERLRPLIKLRSSEPCLWRNETEFFGLNGGFHPSFDANDGERVFAYCRTGGKPPGTPGQVAVVSNAGPASYAEFLVAWPWGAGVSMDEVGSPGPQVIEVAGGAAKLALRPFQTRVLRLV